MICLTLTGKTMSDNVKMFWRNRAYIDIAELRIDFLENILEEMESIVAFPDGVDVPVILTCRRISDGGNFCGSDKKRIALIIKCLEGNFHYCDIESDIHSPELGSVISSKDVKVIRSAHFFEGVPNNLFKIVAKIASKGDIPKIAVKPLSVADVITIFKCEEELKNIKQKIVVGMGSFGLCTRILYKRVGSMLTYCSDNGLLGQISARNMKELYNADRVNMQTKIYGVIGNPIAHSVSPNIHNPGFAGIRFNAIYVPFLVDDVRAFFRLSEALKINGFSVTIPHKQNVLPYLGKTTREVNQIGSCNTVIREKNCWKGCNTDYYGFISLVSKYIESSQIKNAIVIGAGGGARAVVWALRNYGVNVTILNRSIDRAIKLASETMSQYDSLKNAGNYSKKADIVVQATSVGMEGNLEDDPAPDFIFSGKEIYCDLVYKPHTTHMMKRAESAGCTIIHGIDFLLEQGKLQFEVFSGYHYPPNVRPFL